MYYLQIEGQNIQMWDMENAIGNAKTDNKAAGEYLAPCELLIKCLPVQYKNK